MASKLSDYQSAIRLARFVDKRVKRMVNKMTPVDNIGTVTAINRFQQNARVLFPENDTDTEVGMLRGVQPFLIGDQVRCVGQKGALYISQVVGNTHPYMDEPRFARPTEYGGLFGNNTYKSALDGLDMGMPAVGNTWHFGRWEDQEVFSNMIGRIEFDLAVRWFNPAIKTYSVPINFNGTSGAWMKIHPANDSGRFLGDGWEMEIMIDSTGFELRVRRTVASTNAFGSVPPNLYGSIYGNPYVVIQNSGRGEEVTTAPVGSYGALNGPSYTGNYPINLTPEISFGWRANQLMQGGGNVIWDGTNFSWSARFISMGLAQTSLHPGGYFQIPMPTVGTNIQHANQRVTPTYTTVVAAGIPLNSWQALYYEPPLGNAGSASGIFWIYDYATFDTDSGVPGHYILIAVRNNDDGRVYCGTGATFDSWRALSGAYTASFADGTQRTPSVWKDGNGIVHFDGSLTITAVHGTTTSLGKTCPAGYRPGANTVVTGAMGTTGSDVIKVIVNNSGSITVANAITGNAYFQGQWPAEA